MVKRLVIAQLNARHSVAVLDLVAQVLVQEKIDILLLQEPPLALERKLWTLAGYKIYLACGEHPLTAVLVHSHLCTTFLDFWGDRLCGVVIQTNIGELGVFSSYIRPMTGEGLDQLSQGLDMAIGRTWHRLVGMDSNGHSPLWGPKSVKQDQLGRRVEDALAEGNC